MPRLRLSLLLAALAFPACDSKVETQIDEEKLASINAVSECLPDLFGHVQALLELSGTWRQQDDNSDPPGIVVQRDTPSAGEVTATYTYDKGNGISGELSMVIRFFRQASTQRTINYDSPVVASTLSQLLDNAATQMRDDNDPDPFLSGVWTLTGSGGVAGSGAEVGKIGGASNQNELEEVITIVAATPGVPTPSGTTSDEIADDKSDGDATLAFGTESLLTDETPGQEFPIGNVRVSLSREASGDDPAVTVVGRIEFDGTAVATIVVESPIEASFTLNVNTREIELLN